MLDIKSAKVNIKKNYDETNVCLNKVKKNIYLKVKEMFTILFVENKLGFGTVPM